MFGPLIVDRKNERGNYDREVVLVRHEFDQHIETVSPMSPDGSETTNFPRRGRWTSRATVRSPSMERRSAPASARTGCCQVRRCDRDDEPPGFGFSARLTGTLATKGSESSSPTTDNADQLSGETNRAIHSPMLHSPMRVARSMLGHPIHTHGHDFELVRIDDVAMSGIVRDTIVIRPMGGRAEPLLDVDNPFAGRFLLHCHNEEHMDARHGNDHSLRVVTIALTPRASGPFSGLLPDVAASIHPPPTDRRS